MQTKHTIDNILYKNMAHTLAMFKPTYKNSEEYEWCVDWHFLDEDSWDYKHGYTYSISVFKRKKYKRKEPELWKYVHDLKFKAPYTKLYICAICKKFGSIKKIHSYAGDGYRGNYPAHLAIIFDDLFHVKKGLFNYKSFEDYESVNHQIGFGGMYCSKHRKLALEATRSLFTLANCKTICNKIEKNLKELKRKSNYATTTPKSITA